MKKFIIAIISIIIVAIGIVFLMSTDTCEVTWDEPEVTLDTAYYYVNGTKMTSDEYQSWKEYHQEGTRR